MKTFLAGILDAVFPAGCKSCGKKLGLNRESCFCESCWKEIRLIKEPSCIYCGKQLYNINEHFCAACTLRRLSFTDNRSAGVYEGVLKKALHEFKYKGKMSLGTPLGGLMAGYIRGNGGVEDIDLIIPVPIFEKKKDKREYNQAELLADHIGKTFALPVVKDVLIRSADTPPQYKLEVEERFKNVKGAFSVNNTIKIKWACILLIDDLLTTGATADECSKMLLGSGASQIRVFTLARGL